MNQKLFDIKGKTVVLTGGLGLIGLNYIKVLASYGAKVVVIDLMSEKLAQAILEKKLNKAVLNLVFYFQGDVTDKERLRDIRSKILKKFKGIEVLINNAALTHAPKQFDKKERAIFLFENLDLNKWQREIEVNLTGTMLACQIFGEVMKSGASIINTSSIYGVVAPDQSIYPHGYKQPATYGVTKAGIIMLTKYLATYWGSKNIRVNCLVPGGIKHKQEPEFIKNYIKKTPLGRMAKANDFNGLLIFLASNASAYCTGGIFSVDGGWTAW